MLGFMIARDPRWHKAKSELKNLSTMTLLILHSFRSFILSLALLAFAVVEKEKFSSVFSHALWSTLRRFSWKLLSIWLCNRSWKKRARESNNHSFSGWARNAFIKFQQMKNCFQVKMSKFINKLLQFIVYYWTLMIKENKIVNNVR